jgi:hypothetical protein
LVPEEGLEPSQGYPYRILSPARLPFHHSGTRANKIDNERALGLQERGRFRENVAVARWSLRVRLRIVNLSPRRSQRGVAATKQFRNRRMNHKMQRTQQKKLDYFAQRRKGKN